MFPVHLLSAWILSLGQNKKEAPAGASFWDSLESDPPPDGAVFLIGDLDALGLQLIPDAVGLGEILRLLGFVPGQHQRVDVAVAFTGDGVAAGGGSGLGRLLLPELRRLFQQGQGQYLVETCQDGPLGGVVGLG